MFDEAKRRFVMAQPSGESSATIAEEQGAHDNTTPTRESDSAIAVANPNPLPLPYGPSNGGGQEQQQDANYEERACSNAAGKEPMLVPTIQDDDKKEQEQEDCVIKDGMVDQQFETRRTNPSTIHEHMDTLYKYASRCSSVIECGVESGVSCWALLKGVLENKSPLSSKSFVQVDTTWDWSIVAVRSVCERYSVPYEFKLGSDLQVRLEPADLIFIDTFHCYGQMKRELALLAPLAKKYIILHDTVIDAERSEAVRRKWELKDLALQHNFTLDEVERGIWPAIQEFLQRNKGVWMKWAHFTNCAGLTILKRCA